MVVTIDESTDLAAVAERLGIGQAAELRESSSQREPHLTKYARILSGNPTLDLQLNPTRAEADIKTNDLIYIPTREMPQPVTEIPRRTYDLLCQETLTTHEVGHLLYSDWPSLQECFDRLERHLEDDDDIGDEFQTKKWKQIFKDCWNAIEDGVIEDALSRRYNVRNQFDIYNANLSENAIIGSIDDSGDEPIVTYVMKDAITQGLLDVCVYDTGTAARIIDPDDRYHTMTLQSDTNRFAAVYETMPAMFEAVRRTTNATERNARIYAYFLRELYPALKEAEVSGLDQVGQDEGSEDHRSDDAHDGIGDAQESITPPPEPESDPDADEGGKGSGDGDEDDDENSGGAAGADESDEAGTDGAEEALDAAGVTERYNETLEREAREAVGDDVMDEIETFSEIIASRGATAVEIDEIIIPDRAQPNDETKRQAKTLGRRLQPIIEEQLRESRQEALLRRKSFGAVDTRSMIDAERGSLRVFQRQRESDEKDYSCVLVMDRSGTMAGQIREAEIAIGAFMYALEMCDVDVMCLDFCWGQLRLAKPFGSDVDEHAGTLFTGQSGGGTPLASALYYARRRVDEGRGTHPFIMMVTDGQAGNPTLYEEELSATTCPVIGLYLSHTPETSGSEANRFHRLRTVQAGNDGDLATALRQLAGEVML